MFIERSVVFGDIMFIMAHGKQLLVKYFPVNKSHGTKWIHMYTCRYAVAVNNNETAIVHITKKDVTSLLALSDKRRRYSLYMYIHTLYSDWKKTLFK